MAFARFKIISPRPGFTGEGAGQLYFRGGEAELTVDLDDWEQGSKRGALAYFQLQGFGIEPLDGVSADQALRDPSQDALAVQRELDDLDRQIKAETSRDDLEAKRKRLADLRAKRAEQDAAARKGESTSDAPDANQPPAGEGGVNAQLRTDVVPPAPDAPVADWRAYAVEIDPSLDDAAAKQLSKSDLQMRYGSAYAQEGTVTA